MSLRIDRLRARGQEHAAQKHWDAAAACFESILAGAPDDVPALLMLARAHSNRGRYRDGHRLAMDAAVRRPRDPETVLELVKRLRLFNESGAVVDVLRESGFVDCGNPAWLVEMGLMASTVGAHEEALALVDAALRLVPDDVPARYLRGNELMFFGRMGEAEAELERSIALQPNYAQAHWVLSRLRKWTPRENHVERIRKQLARAMPGGHGEVYLGFALHNELHELQRYEESWQALERGCAAKRRLLPYDRAEAIRMFDGLQSLCTGEFVRPVDTPNGAFTPIFIVGMHRSGTTLLEQILGGHSQVTDGGETYLFSGQMRLATDYRSQGPLDAELVARAADADYRAVGEGFLAASAWRARGKPFLTEKLPTNYLNLGFIAKALPQARFLHMMRDPLETLFSNLRTMFSDVCAWSYDQHDLVDYFARYRALMAHWHRVMPGRILDVSYEALVREPEAVARGVFEFCGLPFEAQALELERKAGAVATASSAQVRQGIRRKQVPDWKAYETHLRPLIHALEGLGTGGAALTV